MALTRKSLKAMGLTDEQVDSIIEMHTETVDGLKADVERYKADAKGLPGLQKKLEDAEKELEAAKKDGWKDKHDTVKREFDDYKAEQARKETYAAKEKAVRAYLEGKNIKGGNLTIAMRGLGAEIDAAELEDGRLKDTKALDDLIAGDLAGLVTTTTERAAPPPANPPRNTGGSTARADLYKMDDKGRFVLSTAERQAALAKMIQENKQ